MHFVLQTQDKKKNKLIGYNSPEGTRSGNTSPPVHGRQQRVVTAAAEALAVAHEPQQEGPQVRQVADGRRHGLEVVVVERQDAKL